MNPHAQAFSFDEGATVAQPPFTEIHHDTQFLRKYSSAELLAFQPYALAVPFDFPHDLFIATYFNSAAPAPKYHKPKPLSQSPRLFSAAAAIPASPDQQAPQSPIPSKSAKDEATLTTTPLLRRGGPPLPLRSELKKSKATKASPKVLSQ